VIGRYCYREQTGFGPPAEAPEVIGARERLLTVLDSLGRLLPEDRWILGQKLRYFLEQGRLNTADSVAMGCAANTTVPTTLGWCLALAGYTAQERGDYARADAAFSNALASMPEKERCEFQDLSILLDGRAAGQYKHATCQERDSLAAAFWRLVQPLYLNNVNDLRTEFLARITRMYIERDTRTPMSGHWDSDDRETLLRYGGGQYYTQLARPPGSTREAAIASHRRGPAFNFIPDARSLASPNQLTLQDWEYANVATRSGYAPAWAGSFQPLLENQVALFRRGDSAVVVAAFKITDHVTTSLTKNFRAGVFAAVVDSGNIQTPIGTTLNNVGSTVVSTIRALWRPMIVSLEVMDTSSRAAGRARFALKLPTPGTRLSLSDLLVYTPSDFCAHQLGSSGSASASGASRAEQSPDRSLLGGVRRAPGRRGVRVFASRATDRPELGASHVHQAPYHRSRSFAQCDMERGACRHWRHCVSWRDRGSLAPQARPLSCAPFVDRRRRSADRVGA
jgi:hypothetical protein